MYTRHPLNTNLTLVHGNEWNGLPLLGNHQPFIEEYLQTNLDVMRHVFQEHSRVFVVLLELRFPCGYAIAEQSVITRFLKSLKAQMQADLAARSRQTGRRLTCNVINIWARERNISEHSHFHVALFFNHDAYHTLGVLPSPREVGLDVPIPTIRERAHNMAARLNRAWATALGIREGEAVGLIHYPENATYAIDAGKESFVEDYTQLFRRLSYMAKAATKDYGGYLNCYGSSRVPGPRQNLQPTGI